MMLSDILLQKIKVEQENNLLCVSVYQEITSEESHHLENYAKSKGLSIRMTLGNLSEEQKQSLEEMRNFKIEMDSIPESEKEPIPEKILDRWQSEVG